MRNEVFRVYRYLTYLLNRYLIWGGSYRPARMFSRGREPDQIFSADEILYFRCKKDWIDEDNQAIKPANIPFPNQSVNRQKYSEPQDVLLPDNENKTKQLIYWGVAKILVSDIPVDEKTQGSTGAKAVSYKFRVAHDPEVDNFSHSEIRVYKNNVVANKVKSQQIKKAYRTKLSFKSKIIVKPLI